MRFHSRAELTSPEEMPAKLASVETRGNIALAVAIVAIGTQFVLAVFLFKIWLNARPSRRKSADPERGLELDNVPRNAATSTHTRRPFPASTSPVAPTPAEARGRPVPAYGHTTVHGESEEYYNTAPHSGGGQRTRSRQRTPHSGGRRPSRQPTYTADSGRGEQTHGADYSTQQREARHGSDAPHRTNTNDANYGRKGNKYAHGT